MSSSSLLLLLPLLLLGSSAHAQSINIPGVLTADGQLDQFLRLLNRTRVIEQVDDELGQIDQLNISLAGVTLLAPTNNAFLNLPPGALDNLSPQQRVELVQNHICPKYYSLRSVRSLTTGLNTTAKRNQVNVPTGAVEAPVYTDFPLAVYRLDKVLMPRFDDGAGDDKAPEPAPAENGRVAGAAAGRIGLAAAFWVMCMGLVL